jgi:calreticulin
VQSDHKKSDGTAGKFKLSAGKWYGDADKDAGAQTSADARFYAYTSMLDTPFNTKDGSGDLVVQFSVKHEQQIDCGGGYIKLLPSSVNQAKFNGDTPYHVMFGPDICGNTKRVHSIFTYNDENLLIKKEVAAETDQLTHVYTLIVHTADNTYEIRVDGVKKQGGSLFEDWDFLKVGAITLASAIFTHFTL